MNTVYQHATEGPRVHEFSCGDELEELTLADIKGDTIPVLTKVIRTGTKEETSDLEGV